MRFKKQIFTILILALLVALAASASAKIGDGAKESSKSVFEFPNIMKNAQTPWNPHPTAPVINRTAYVHPEASVIGAVKIGANVMVSPFASVRGDEGMPIFIGANSNVQDGVVVHGLETIDEELEPVTKNIVNVNGKNYSVYVGNNVSLAHQSQVHGPAVVGDDTFIGMQAFVFKSHVGKGCVLEPKSAAIGVDIADGKYIPAGVVVTTQAQANALKNIADEPNYGYKTTNKAVVYVNVNLAKGYNKAALH
jgi:carbonic anhydrase